MEKWFIAAGVAFLALGWLVLSGVFHLAGELIKIGAYGAFGFAVVSFVLGGYLYLRLKGGSTPSASVV